MTTAQNIRPHLHVADQIVTDGPFVDARQHIHVADQVVDPDGLNEFQRAGIKFHNHADHQVLDEE